MSKNPEYLKQSRELDKQRAKIAEKELEIREGLPLNPKLLKVDETFFDDTVSVKEKRDLPKQVKRRLKMSSVKQEFTRTEINEVIKQVNEELKTNFKEI